jgi:predicted Fe-Mo cluster-binding NifX family protein
LVLVSLSEGREVARKQASLVANDPMRRAKEVAALGADLLICGAISRPLETALSAEGVQVRPHACGAIDEVLAAFQEGRLDESAFQMPGCGKRRRRCRGGRQTAGRYTPR